MDELTSKALNNPKKGDHWTEMFNWDLFVVGRSKDLVFTLEGTRPSVFPNGSSIVARIRSVSEFKKDMSYTTKAYGVDSGTWAVCIERGRDVSGWKKARFQWKWSPK